MCIAQYPRRVMPRLMITRIYLTASVMFIDFYTMDIQKLNQFTGQFECDAINVKER